MSSIMQSMWEQEMSSTERNVNQEKLQKWLVEEGYTVKLKDDPQAYFTLVTEHPTHVVLNVLQPLRSKDSILVVGRLPFPEEYVAKLRALPEKERVNFLWGLRFDLIANQVQFQLQPNGVDPTAIVVLNTVWYDGLTKDRAMTAVQHIADATLLVMWKFQQLFGSLAPKQEQKYVS
jgi:hypothetical protein